MGHNDTRKGKAEPAEGINKLICNNRRAFQLSAFFILPPIRIFRPFGRNNNGKMAPTLPPAECLTNFIMKIYPYKHIHAAINENLSPVIRYTFAQLLTNLCGMTTQLCAPLSM